MVRKPKRGKFWDKEYLNAEHLALSRTPSEDLEKFCRFLERHYGKQYLNPMARVFDAGCGNGRNAIYLAQTYGMKGAGIDSSQEAIDQAIRYGTEVNAPFDFEHRSITEPLPLPDNSQTLVLDMMVSHVLSSNERKSFLEEIVRVLRIDGWYFFKTFLLDEDRNAMRMLKENPGSEPGTYVHPDIGVEEHVFTTTEIVQLLEPYFTIHKLSPSHRHLKHGKANKRRSICVYAQKK